MLTHDNKVAARYGRILHLLDGCIKGELSPGVRKRMESNCQSVVCRNGLVKMEFFGVLVGKQETGIELFPVSGK